jgi:hypothetical protein
VSDGPVLKPTIRYVSNDLLTREQPISAQKEELVLPYALNRFPHKSADATGSTVLGYVSSYIRQVEMDQYPLEVLLTPKCSVIDELTFSLGNNLSVRRRKSLYYHVPSHSQ